MRPVSATALVAGCLVQLVVGGGCAKRRPDAGARTEPATANVRATPGAVKPPAPVPDAAAVTIESFDCFKLEGDPAVDAIPTVPGISSWNAGGPAGATWNASELLCATKVRTTCTDGEILSEVRVGNVVVAQRRDAIRDQHVESRFPLHQKQWKRHLDEVAPSRQRELYRTGLFRLTASLTCRAPYELQPGIGPRNEFAADRIFVAGFAEGE